MPASDPREKKAGLAYWAARVLEECDRASAAFAPDPVHDLRVAIRRCRSMADGFLSVDPDPAWKQMKKLGKPLFSSLGELRDTQVMLEWVAKLSPAADPLGQSLGASLLYREAQLKAAAQNALGDFDRKRWTSLNAHLAKRSGRIPLEGAVFQHLALERWMEARELHRRALRNRSAVAWHQLRIGIKRFRYTVENFLPQRHERWSKDLRELQDALGEAHDFDVLRGLIRAHPQVDAGDRLKWLERVAEERQKRLDLYRRRMVGRHSLWQAWRAELPAGAALEEAAVEKLTAWASFLDPDVPHSKLVAQLAAELYDGLLQCGILESAPGRRGLLQGAALLHEVGRSRLVDGAHGSHQKRGWRMILKLKPPLGWSEDEIRCVAAMVRYHRGPLPVASNSSFAGLSAERRAGLMPIIGVLRLANALDEAHDRSISRVAVELQGGTIVVRALGLQPMSPGAERIARARYLLETLCRLPIVVCPMARQPATAAGKVKAGQPATAMPVRGGVG
ncbi:MAG TPA: CHAD domain-containing protein [Candidatus Binatia bacterium]|nr:CHAD domain-containing protein [Candidatus Binatia bacterium]